MNNYKSYQDTYFLDSQKALIIAQKQNKVFAPNKIVSGLQICYYHGTPLINAPINCIHVPLHLMVDYFSKTKNRLPQTFNDTSNQDNKETYKKNMEIIQEIRQNKLIKFIHKIKNNKPNFADKPFRIFAYACRETRLIQHIVKDIIDEFDTLGYKVYLHTQDNNMQGCHQLTYLEALYQFNPHITININHLNHHFLHDDVFNVIWIQDQMPLILDEAPIKLRQRDIVLHLTKLLRNILILKNIDSIYQPFCINTKIYKNRKNIKRENKIVFIGSSYKQRFDLLHSKNKYIASDEIYNYCIKKGYISQQQRKSLEEKYCMSHNDMNHIFNYVERDLFLKYIINLNLDLDIEIYGFDWEKDSFFNLYHQGALSYGEEISQIYNQAKYTLVLGGYVLQQRTLEAAASGTIPLVFDVRIDEENSQQYAFNESLIFFKKPKDIITILEKNNAKNLEEIVQRYSYKRFSENIINHIKKKMNIR